MIINWNTSFSYSDQDFIVKELQECDVSETYLKWLNSDFITEYLSLKKGRVTQSDQLAYVRNQMNSKTDVLLGVFDRKKELIGTTGIQNYQQPFTCSMGIIIGPAEYRGIGLAKYIIWAVSALIFQSTKRDMIYVAIEKNNIPSLKGFLRAGYQIINGSKEFSSINVDTRFSIKESCEYLVCKKMNLINPGLC